VSAITKPGHPCRGDQQAVTGKGNAFNHAVSVPQGIIKTWESLAVLAIRINSQGPEQIGAQSTGAGYLSNSGMSSFYVASAISAGFVDQGFNVAYTS
jgi:hypothetical protein